MGRLLGACDDEAAPPTTITHGGSPIAQDNGVADRVRFQPEQVAAYEVGDVVWAAFEPLIPVPTDTHPLGVHRRHKSDRDCFAVMLVRLVTGCSWEDAERLCGNKVSDTTVRSRRDEWIAAGVFDKLETEAIAAYDKIVGLVFADVAVDGSLHKSPCGGEGTGPNPTDRGQLGWKWSILTDRNGIPVGVAIDGANRNDSVMLAPTLDDADIDATNWRGYQAIRPAVVNRKVWGGNRTWRGAATQGRIMSAIRTATQQGIDPIDFLIRLARAPDPVAISLFT